MSNSSEMQVPSAAASFLWTPPGMIVVVGIITALRLAYLAVFPFDLHPDEAQYWSWSLNPDWGYFSKPPLVAWLIGAASFLCGPGESCIKASVPLLHGITALFIYGAGSRLYDRRAGFFAGILFLTLPGISFSSTIISTDPPLLTCWAAAFYALVRIRETAGRAVGWWLALGLAAGFGLLSKYALGFFALGLALWLVIDGEGRRDLLAHGRGRMGLMLAAGTAFLLYLPNLLWNMGSHFVTYAHTASNADLGGRLLRPEKFLEFMASQFGVFGPIVFAVLLWLVIRPDRWLREPRTRLLACFVLAMLGPILVLSFLTRANANWAAPTYVAGSIWVAGFLMAGSWRARWAGHMAMYGSLALHITVAAVIMVGSIGQPKPGRYAGFAVPSRIDPYKHYSGWRELGNEVSRLRVQYPGLTLLGHDRMVIAALLYYAKPAPVPILAWHPDGRITDHYRLTRPLAARPGGDYLLVSRRTLPENVLERFRKHKLVATITEPIATGSNRTIRVFHVTGFLGYKRARP